MDLQEIGGGRGYWIELAQDRDRWPGTCGYGEELSSYINAGNSCVCPTKERGNKIEGKFC
jgi:hypothetical protein